MLSEENVKAVGPNCAKLHAYVMEHSKDKLAFPSKVDQDYFNWCPLRKFLVGPEKTTTSRDRWLVVTAIV
jgi:hypothetical protein